MATNLPLTELIQQASRGDERAFQIIFDATYDELRKIARSRLARNSRGTLLDTTALVHESYLRLVKARELTVTDRAHFFRYAGQVMRSVVVDFARMRMAERRGGGAADVTLNTQVDVAAAAGEEEVLRIHDALAELAPFVAADGKCLCRRRTVVIDDVTVVVLCAPIAAQPPGSDSHRSERVKNLRRGSANCV